MALEWVYGADFWCIRHSATSPIFLEGFRLDPGNPENPKISENFGAEGGRRRTH